MSKIAAFVLSKTLDSLRQNAFSIGQMRKVLSIVKKVTEHPEMVAFTEGLDALEEPMAKEKFASDTGYADVGFDFTDDEAAFLKEVFVSTLQPAFVPNLDKRVVVSMADALGVE